MRMLCSLISKDCLVLSRRPEYLLSVAGFSLVLIIIASFSFRYLGFDPRDISALSAGVIWMIFLFTAVIALNNSFAHEQAGQAMLGIVMSGVDLGTFYLSKLLVNFLLLFVMQ